MFGVKAIPLAQRILEDLDGAFSLTSHDTKIRVAKIALELIPAFRAQAGTAGKIQLGGLWEVLKGHKTSIVLQLTTRRGEFWKELQAYSLTACPGIRDFMAKVAKSAPFSIRFLRLSTND